MRSRALESLRAHLPAGRYVLHVLVFFVFVFEIISGFFLRENYDLKRCVCRLSRRGPSIPRRAAR